MRIRIPVKSKWALPKQTYLTVYHFALQYSEWKDKHDTLCGLRAVAQDGQPHGTTVGNPTETQGIELADLEDKMRLVENTVELVAPSIYKWLLKAVTTDGITYDYLSGIMGIPCGRNYYFDKRREFYFRLNEKIKLGHTRDMSM